MTRKSHCEWCGEPYVCPNCEAFRTSGQFKPSTKPVAGIKRTAEKYYVLTMDGREMGGTNKAALAAYARKQGYKVVAE